MQTIESTQKELFNKVTFLINQISFENKNFVEFFDKSKYFKNLKKRIEKNDLNIHILNDEYELFLIDNLVSEITNFDENLSLSDTNEINQFFIDFYNNEKALLLHLIAEKLPFEKIEKYIIDKIYFSDINSKNNSIQNINDKLYQEKMNELYEKNNFYSFSKFYNNFNLKNPSFKEDKVFSNKKLVKKIYHYNERQIKFYFDKETKNLEFFIVENYELTDLNFDIQENLDLDEIINEFKKSL